MFSSMLGKQVSFVAVVVCLFSFMAATPAHADSFILHALASANGNNLFGIDSSDDVVIDVSFGDCAGPYSGCYLEFLPTGAVTSATAIPQSLTYDNREQCSSSLPAGFTVSNQSRCNNGYMVFGGEYYNPVLAATLCTGSLVGAEAEFCANHGTLIGVFTGFDPFADFIPGVSGDGIVLNANGDFAFVSGRDETIYSALRTNPVPEPCSLIFVATGFLMTGIRRFSR